VEYVFHEDGPNRPKGSTTQIGGCCRSGGFPAFPTPPLPRSRPLLAHMAMTAYDIDSLRAERGAGAHATGATDL
jgi:hypothetical protein